MAEIEHISDEGTYDVALSFAGEQRAYVSNVALALREMGIRVFYDLFEEETLWGKNLYDYLHSIYSKRAEYTVIFVSKNYSEKLWTTHERKSAQEKAFRESREYILPARFDDTSIPGIGETTGYIDCTKRTPEQFAEIVAKKLGKLPSGFQSSQSNNRAKLTNTAFEGVALLGLLIYAGARGWCVASQTPLHTNTIPVSESVSIVPNDGEVFRDRQQLGISRFKDAKDFLEKLAEAIGCAFHILSPLALVESTSERFFRSDQKYILKEKILINKSQVPVSSDPYSYFPIISSDGTDFFAYAAPVDYVSDAFGIEVFKDKKREGVILFRESTFLRNAKFLAIEPLTNKYLAFISIDKELEMSKLESSCDATVKYVNDLISTVRRPVQLRSSSFVVETKEQKFRRENSISSECNLCSDTKEMVVSHNLRLYRVPCPDCSSNVNQTWLAFFSAKDRQQDSKGDGDWL